MHDITLWQLTRGSRKRRSEPAIYRGLTDYPFRLCTHSLHEITTSQHQLFVDYCSDSYGVGSPQSRPRRPSRPKPRGSTHTLANTPPLSPSGLSPGPNALALAQLTTTGSPVLPNQYSHYRYCQRKGRRTSLGVAGSRSPNSRRTSLSVPGSRSPNSRRMCRETYELEDPWLEFHRQRSPSTNYCVSQLFDEEQGYRCRSFSVTSKGVVINLGEVILNSDDERRKSTSSCPNGPEETPPLHRVRLIGAPGVGKSCLIRQFVEGASATPGQNIVTSPPTSTENSLETQSTRVLLDGEDCEVEFEETTDPRVSRQQLDELDAFIVVFSVTDSESMDLAENVVSRLRNLCGSKNYQRKLSSTASSSECSYLNRPITKAIILVANKVDLVRRRIVPKEEARSVAKRFECKFIETSACIGHNVDELLVGTLKQIRLKQRSGSVPAWCTLAGHPSLASSSPLPTIRLPPGEHLDALQSSEHSTLPSPLPLPPPSMIPIVAQRPSAARTLCGKARVFLTFLWTKCDVVKTRSCDNLNVL